MKQHTSHHPMNMQQQHELPAENDLVRSGWSHIYPCSEGCGFVGSLNAFSTGHCYCPCPRCGATRTQKTGRFIYRLMPVRFLPFLKYKVYVGVEWRTSP